MKHTLTPEKVIQILKQHGQEITLEDAEKVLCLVRDMVPTAIENAKKQIAEEDSLNNGSNPAGTGSK